MTICGNLSNKEKLGLPDVIVCPDSVYENWKNALLLETDGSVSSVNCVVANIENLFI